MKNTTSAIILALGFIISSLIIGVYWKASRSAERYVTVKGLSEREVEADRAWFAIRTNIGSNSVEEMRKSIKDAENEIVSYLKKQGFTSQEYKVDNVNIYQNNYNNATYRYNGDLRVSVASDDVNKVESASSNVTDLIEQGVLISGDQWSNGPKYFFTKFTDVKTEMIAEATKEAEKAAEEFATNSGSEVGKIRRANQGIVQILPGDRSNENAEFYKNKVIRVVSTLDFYLN